MEIVNSWLIRAVKNFASYNVTLSGLPSTVICGLTADNEVDGTVVPVGTTQAVATGSPASTLRALATSSSSSQSSGGKPPSVPFKALSPKHHTCLSYDTTSLCLPARRIHKTKRDGIRNQASRHPKNFPQRETEISPYIGNGPQKLISEPTTQTAPAQAISPHLPTVQYTIDLQPTWKPSTPTRTRLPPSPSSPSFPTIPAPTPSVASSPTPNSVATRGARA